jgi:N-glycosylase/DNA lyase
VFVLCELLNCHDGDCDTLGKVIRICLLNDLCSYQANTTGQMFCHSFISHIRDMFQPTILAIVRRHYKNVKAKTDRTKVETSSLVLLGRFISSISFTFYIFVGTLVDGHNYLPKHVTYVRNK